MALLSINDATGCQEVNECDQGLHNCDPNASCTWIGNANTDGKRFTVSLFAKYYSVAIP